MNKKLSKKEEEELYKFNGRKPVTTVHLEFVTKLFKKEEEYLNQGKFIPRSKVNFNRVDLLVFEPVPIFSVRFLYRQYLRMKYRCMNLVNYLACKFQYLRSKYL